MPAGAREEGHYRVRSTTRKEAADLAAYNAVSGSLVNWRSWYAPAIVSVLLIVIARYSYLTFHTFVELFTIVISFLIFAFAWSTREFSRNSFLLFLACGYFWIGSLDLMHTLSFEGMDVFAKGSTALTIQFWLAARFFEAILLFVAPLVAARRLSGNLLFSAFGILAVALTSLILMGIFPLGYVEGVGLTDFKVYSEYAIDLILALALVSLFRSGQDIALNEKALIGIAIILTMCAELAFTFYVSVDSPANLIGHILKLFSFWLIFQAVVILHLQVPYMTLQRSESEYRNILENMVDTFYRADHEGRIVMVSPSAENLMGYSTHDLIGKKLSEFYVDEDKRQEFLDKLLHGSGEVSDFEAELKTGSGKQIWVSTSAHSWRGGEGELPGVEGIIRNITLNKDAEASLRRSQKMEVVGQLTGGIAHDYNNMLGVIIGNLQMIKKAKGLDEKSRERLAKAEIAAHRSADLTSKLLGISSTRIRATRLTSANDLIAGLKDIIATSSTASIDVRTDLPEDLWLVDIDPAELEDMTLNLAINARDAMPDGGTLAIEASNKKLDEGFVRHHPGSEVGDYVMIAVSDTGTGMTRDVRDQMFDPFFSTKLEGKGTGLGLNMVYAFVQRAGGFIKVYSEPGEGTVVNVFFPKAQGTEEAVVASEPMSDPQPVGGKETVLVVDDEEFLVDLAVDFLEDLGYQTRSAANAEEALEVLKTTPDIDLLFTDVIMPGKLDGYSLAGQALKAQPSLKVLLTSGFSEDRGQIINGNDRALAALVTNSLAKPYTLTDLAEAVRHCLDDGSSASA